MKRCVFLLSCGLLFVVVHSNLLFLDVACVSFFVCVCRLFVVVCFRLFVGWFVRW